MTGAPLVQLTGTLKVLTHPARIRLLAMLRSGGLCVCQAAAALAAPVSTVSEHLAELRRAGLVVERRDGRWVIYTLAGAPESRALLEHVWRRIARDDLVRRDERVVRKLRRVSPAELCEAGLDVRRFGAEPAAH